MAACLAFGTNTAAAVVHLVDASGKLTGARNVSVGGKLYTVEFLDGTCQAVFSGCNSASDFAFGGDAAGALAASQALNDTVFVNGVRIGAATFNFDRTTNRARGCTSVRQCTVVTAFNILPAGGIAAALFTNRRALSDPAPVTTQISATLNLATLASETFARWSIVPLPAAGLALPGGLAALGLLGLLGLLGRRRPAA